MTIVPRLRGARYEVVMTRQGADAGQVTLPE